jgi:uncharacterized protein YjbJ (UPF0337 family)
MGWDSIEGMWKQAKDKVKEKWGKLIDDDLDVIEGARPPNDGSVLAFPS